MDTHSREITLLIGNCSSGKNSLVEDTISIYHKYCVWIESVTRVTIQHHETCLVIANGDPLDGYFYSHLIIVIDIFSDIPFNLQPLIVNKEFSKMYNLSIFLEGSILVKKKPALSATDIRFFTLTPEVAYGDVILQFSRRHVL